MVESIICRGTRTIGTFVSLCALTACAVPAPLGPTVMALPPSGKSLTTFQQEDQQCRNYAAAEIGYVQPGQAGTQAAVGSSAVGTVVGAVAGAAIGAAAENPAAGAAIGAATGLVGGTAVGANNAAASEFDLQTRYNITYSQCMYSLGNTIQSPPVYGYGYPWHGYADYGYPWYGWGWPGGLFLGGVIAFGGFDHFHHFHHFHGGFAGGGGHSHRG